MEKKTKLITIEYEEYLHLCLSDRERTIKSCENLINSLEDYRKYYNPGEEFSKLLNTLVNHFNVQILCNKKEGENNE